MHGSRGSTASAKAMGTKHQFRFELRREEMTSILVNLKLIRPSDAGARRLTIAKRWLADTKGAAALPNPSHATKKPQNEYTAVHHPDCEEVGTADEGLTTPSLADSNPWLGGALADTAERKNLQLLLFSYCCKILPATKCCYAVIID